MKTTYLPGILARTALLLALLVLPLTLTLAQTGDSAAASAATVATAAAANAAAANVAPITDATNPEMADGLRQSGKIYVVVASVVVIIGGLLAYLVALDRKVTRLEQDHRLN